MKRVVQVAHRRWGKDDIALHRAAVAAHERIGNYWHMLPEASQARKAIWEAINPHTGKRRIDEAFPEAIRKRDRDSDMLIEFRSGSTWQVVGSDNFNSLVGAAPLGVTYSEFALSNPLSWTYLRPILRENRGWAFFIYTSRGRNHGYEHYELAKRLMREGKDWYADLQGVDQTGMQALRDEEIAEGMSEEMAEQEYDCSFDSASPGAYYGKEIREARRAGRIGRVPAEAGVPVELWFDLGMDDSMSIWFTQTIVREIRLLHYYENSGFGLSHYADYIRKWAQGYEYSVSKRAWGTAKVRSELVVTKTGFPHDGKVRELGIGKSRKDYWESDLLMGYTECAPNLDLLDGIESVRRMFPQFWIDEEGCKQGIACLTSYTKDWDEKNRCFRQTPKHNWACHGADSLRSMALLHPGRAKAIKTQESDRYATKKRRPTTWMSS